jgi:hypothetical protein
MDNVEKRKKFAPIGTQTDPLILQPTLRCYEDSELFIKTAVINQNPHQV